MGERKSAEREKGRGGREEGSRNDVGNNVGNEYIEVDD